MNNELAKINNEGKIEIAEDVIKQIRKFSQAKAKMDVMQEELKATMLELMEKTGADKFVSNDGLIVVNYFPEKTTTRLDQKRLKEEKPDIYEEFSKESVTKSFVKMTVK